MPLSVSAEKLIECFPTLLAALDGRLSAEAKSPSSQDHPVADSVVFIAEESRLPALLKSPASIIVVHKKIAPQAKLANQGRKTLLESPNTYLAMALVNSRFFALPHLKSNWWGPHVHPTAVLAPSAQIHESAKVGPYCVIAEHSVIGPRTYVGAHTVIEAHTTIGADCFIHPHVYIGHNCQIGDRVEIKPQSTIGSDGFGYAHNEKGEHFRIPHYGAVLIENDVHIGANVNVDRGTFEPAIIGFGTKIDNHCHLGHNVRIGKNCLMTAGFMAAGSATIGDNCVFGGRTSVNGHITISSGCTFGPHSAVTNDVTKPGTYAGFPPIPFRDFLKVQASLEHLPALRKKVAKLLKHLGLSESDGSNING